ncbi:MAG: dihydrodipicolinate reductase C-terminal domain-containing protein, partial [Pseudomonadota bacterium]|nr:dihydrodipicolinate reductase C-terminal domain-containing protein [Pseudomonadota bacterium]
QAGQIGIHALRGGSVVGEHTVIFATPGERIEIKHQAQSRQNFAEGALRACQWLSGQPKGVYSMTDVLNLDQFE